MDDVGISTSSIPNIQILHWHWRRGCGWGRGSVEACVKRKRPP